MRRPFTGPGPFKCGNHSNNQIKTFIMLRLALSFFIIAIIAALFGFGGIASGAMAIAKVVFYIFIVLFLLTLIFGGIRRV